MSLSRLQDHLRIHPIQALFLQGLGVIHEAGLDRRTQAGVHHTQVDRSRVQLQLQNRDRRSRRDLVQKEILEKIQIQMRIERRNIKKGTLRSKLHSLSHLHRIATRMVRKLRNHY